MTTTSDEAHCPKCSNSNVSLLRREGCKIYCTVCGRFSSIKGTANDHRNRMMQTPIATR